MIVIQLSDPHILAPGELLYRRFDTAEFLARAVAEINRLDPLPDVAVVTGDRPSPHRAVVVGSQSRPKRGKHVAAIVRLVHNTNSGKGAKQTRKRRRVRGGGPGERRHILGLLPEMVRETKFRRGVDELSDPAARQQVVHSRGGFSAFGLVLRHFSSQKRHFAADQGLSMLRTAIR
jgi:hypothetical protein